MEERKRVFLSVTPVQHARIMDAATHEGYVTATQWMRNVLMEKVERVEKKQAKSYR